MRHAIYFSPPGNAALTRAAEAWLGRSAFSGERVEASSAGRLSAEEIAGHTAAARRYGFHATLMAPFTLADDVDEGALIAALDDFCATTRSVLLPRLELSRLGRFFALTPQGESSELSALARAVVITFDRFRAPLSDSERQRRAADLTAPQLRNLERWGYPYVFDDFQFHMTLTGRVDDADASRVRHAIEEHFGPVLDQPLEIASLALFVEPEPQGPFVVRSFHEIGPVPDMKTA